MLWLYRLLFLPALLVLAPGYLRRMQRRGGYRENFVHRLGAHPQLPAKSGRARRVWLQAVSVGEMLAIGPILDGLKQAGVEVYLTTTTSTGFQLAQTRYADRTVGIGYFPIDWWPFSARAWRRIAPDLVVLTEGERWPEHLHQARLRGVPVLSINARLSDRSFQRLQRFRPVARLLLDGLTRILACSAQDEARLRGLGVPAERISTSGNIKLDLALTPLSDRDRARWRRELGFPAGQWILLGSSTWPGEEEALLGAWRQARDKGLPVSLLLVPRHAERRLEIETQLRAAGVSYHFRSRGPAPGEVEVTVADTTGELRALTQLVDLVFVGKSLPPHTEGQTPVEAAAAEKPILFGPGMSNFRDIARDLVSRGAACVVTDQTALRGTIENLLGDPARRAALARAAAEWRQENAGAVARTLAEIQAELAKIPVDRPTRR